MLYSTDRDSHRRHAGSLPRPPELRDMVAAGKADAEHRMMRRCLTQHLRAGVAEVVRRQIKCGIDCSE